MAWQDDMVEILRVMVNDMDEEAYTAAKLERVLVVSAFQVLNEVDFPQDFSVSISQTSISPDPTVPAYRDNSFVNLTCLKAACVIDRGGAVTAAQRAISVRDGGSAVDLRGVFQGKLALLEKGWCAVYEDQKFEYLVGEGRVAGAVVMGPFRQVAGIMSGRVLDYDGRNFDG